MALINGKEFSWASIEARMDGGAPMIGFTAIKYPWKVERNHVFGARRKPLGMTRGKLMPDDGSITMNESEYRLLSSTTGWCDTVRTIIVQYAEEGLPTYTDTIIGVRFTGADAGAEEGTDGLKREVSFKFMDIKLNGASPIGA